MKLEVNILKKAIDVISMVEEKFGGVSGEKKYNEAVEILTEQVKEDVDIPEGKFTDPIFISTIIEIVINVINIIQKKDWKLIFKLVPLIGKLL